MFGKFIKERRIKKGLTLREFCKLIEVDASNWSKIERGLLAPPKSEYKLKQIAENLGIPIGSDPWFEMKDRAELDTGSIPKDIRSDKELIGYLPMFFRTLRSEKPSAEELDKLIDIIRKGGSNCLLRNSNVNGFIGKTSIDLPMRSDQNIGRRIYCQ